MKQLGFFVELLQNLFLFAKLTSWKDTHKHNVPAKDTTNLVPIVQDNLDQTKLEDSKRGCCRLWNESLSFKSNYYKKFFHIFSNFFEWRMRFDITREKLSLPRTVQFCCRLSSYIPRLSWEFWIENVQAFKSLLKLSI